MTLEGGEGAGKTTQARALYEELRAEGRDVVSTREPGGVPLAEAVRAVILDATLGPTDPMTELFLYAACRAEHRSAVIVPALERGAIVICDRYSDATVAYQGFGRGLPIPVVREVCRFSEQGVRPDLTLLVDVPPAVGIARARRRGETTRFEDEAMAFHERVREGYLAQSREEPWRFAVIDGTAPEPDVLAALLAALRARLARRESR